MAKETTTAVVKYEAAAPIASRGNMQGLLEGMKAKMAAVLPKHVDPERMMKAALVAVIRQPKLLQCTQESFLESMMRSSQLGLDPSGTLGSAYLVPFENRKAGRVECQFLPGYRGLVDLARRSNEIEAIEAHMVYKQDQFKMTFGTDPKIEHTPYLGEDRKEEYVGVYAVATLRGGHKQPDFMTLADINRIRNMSKAGQFGPWKEHFVEMAKKTVIRRLCKTLPMSVELAKAIQYDNEALETIDGAFVDVTDEPRGTEGLKVKLTKPAEPKPAEKAPAAEPEDEAPKAEESPGAEGSPTDPGDALGADW